MSELHLIMPMGGRGSRFSGQGFDFPKPLIEIQGKPFFFWAVQSIVKFTRVRDIIFVVLQEHVDKYQIDAKILEIYPEAIIHIIPEVLNGAVLTCMEGIKEVQDDYPVLFNDCDHLFKCSQFYSYLEKNENSGSDGILLTFEATEPKYSFLECDEQGRVIRTMEKVAISRDAICGAYYFKNKKLFLNTAEKYLKSCNYSEYFMSGVYNVLASEKYDIRYFRTDYHVPFGVPEEYDQAKTSERFKELI